MTISSKPLPDQLESLFEDRTLAEIEAALAEVSRRYSQRIVSAARNQDRSSNIGIEAAETAKAKTATRKKLSPKESLERKIQQLRRSSRLTNVEIAKFADDVGAKRALISSSDIVRFSQSLNLPLSGKKIERAALARKIAETLERRDPNAALDLIERGRRMGMEQSSLQRWADVIVKKTDSNA